MGLLDFLKKRPVENPPKTVQPEAPVKAETPPFELITQENQRFSNYLVPAEKEGAKKKLDKKFKLSYVDRAAAEKALQEKRWKLTLALVDGRVHALSNGSNIGTLQKVATAQEWLDAEDPYVAILEQVNSEKGCVARIVFYRNMAKHYADREQSVVGLTGYKSKRFQENGEWIPPDSELYAREDYDTYDRVIVFYDGQPIGFMPKSESARFLDGDPVLTVYDHCEDDESGKSQPFVRIYW